MVSDAHEADIVDPVKAFVPALSADCGPPGMQHDNSKHGSICHWSACKQAYAVQLVLELLA